jgi:hypothetical protein
MSPSPYVQPRSRKISSKMGIGMPRSHNKMYPVAPACCIVVLSFIMCVLSSKSDWQAFCVFPREYQRLIGYQSGNLLLSDI